MTPAVTVLHVHSLRSLPGHELGVGTWWPPGGGLVAVGGGLVMTSASIVLHVHSRHELGVGTWWPPKGGRG